MDLAAPGGRRLRSARTPCLRVPCLRIPWTRAVAARRCKLLTGAGNHLGCGHTTGYGAVEAFAAAKTVAP